MKTLVITSCTGEKRFHPDNQLVQEDFIHQEQLKKREQELSDYVTSAADMYTGMQHLRLMEGINALREKFGHDIVDLYVVSAGYGLIHEDRQIVPYEVTFNSMNSTGIVSWANQLQIHNDLDAIIAQYDLVFFLLGDKYLKAVNLPLNSARDNQQLLVFASGTSQKMIPNTVPYHLVEVGQEDAKSFSYGLVGLKGYLFKLLAQDMISGETDLLDHLFADPLYIKVALDRHRKTVDNTPKPEQLSLFPVESISKGQNKAKKKIPAPDFFIPENEYAANYTPHLKYFIPEWDDRVDPDYDFITDTATEGRDPYSHDVYAHEIYHTPNYDGVLISKIIIEQNKTKKARIEEVGVHRFIRFDENKPIMGDCGAFGYIDEDVPPFETTEILDYYQRLGFNIGVSIDHLIVGPYASNVDERNRRYKLTRKNAEDFLQKYKSGNYTFLPSGVAQGWDPKSYRDSVAALIEMGYQHVCIGGMVRTKTAEIIEILKEIKPIVPDYLQMHLFGVARPEGLVAFRQHGITAMDSASFLRRAWLGAKDNYFSTVDNKYAAIRVPPVNEHGKRVKTMVAEGRGTIEQFKQLEEAAMSALRRFDAGELSVDDTLVPVLEYDRLIGEDRDSHAQLYRRLLEDQPWKKCGCEICRTVGIDTVIFRGNNRNRRRGFHNTFVFYKYLKELYPDD